MASTSMRKAVVHESGDAYAGTGRPLLGEEFHPNAGHGLPVLLNLVSRAVEAVVGIEFDDVAPGGTGLGQYCGERLEYIAGLRLDVTLSEDVSVFVRRELAAGEDEVPDPPSL